MVMISHFAFYVLQHKSCPWNDWWIFLHLLVFYMWHPILLYHIQCLGRHADFFRDKYRTFFHRMILYMDPHSDRHACFSCCLIVFPFHFGADEFHGWQTASEMGFTSFPFHRKSRILWTARNTVFIQRAVGFRKGHSAIKRNICFFNRSFLKQIFIDLNRVKSCITKKRIGID